MRLCRGGKSEMNMVRHFERCRPGSTELYVCICGQAFACFEQLQSHAYDTDCLFPQIAGEVAA